MPLYTDALGRQVTITQKPQRIISVVPSQTELLHYLDVSVTGITKFCVHPQQWHRSLPHVGGTKNLNLDKIKSLNPDLIIANKEENTQAQIETLALHYPVWVSDVNNLSDALWMIENIGAITNTTKKAKKLQEDITKGFTTLQQQANTPIPACYLIWKEPYMTIGGDTFINHMLQQAGFINMFAHSTRYPQITLEQLQQMQVPLLLLSSEPYPFAQKHIDALQPLLPNTKIIIVDGEMFSWYGSRLLQAPIYFAQIQQQLQSMGF